MSITNKKIDSLRRLLLGNLYQECKDNPMGVSRERLEQHLEKIKGEGCIGDCSVEEFVKTCQLKTHYPTCVTGEYRTCMEDIGERSTGIDKFYYNQYRTSKMVENEPDTDEEEEEGEVCNVCSLSGDDDIGMPVEQMSCGHHSHINCLIKIAQQKGRDNAECPECRKEFPLTEVPVPARTLQQRQADSMRRAQFNASQMGFNVRNDDEEEEQTEEDILSNGIIEGIEFGAIGEDGVIPEIREFYRRDLNRRSLIEYIRKWSIAILGLIEHEDDLNINELKSLVDTIFQVNITLSSFNNRFIKRLTELYTRGNETRKEALLYIIKSITKHHIDRNDGLTYFVETMMGNSSVELFEEVMRVAEENNANEILKDSINETIDNIDLDRVNDDIKNLITNWFNRHNYTAPTFENDNVAQQLTDTIVQHIEHRYFIGAEAAIEEFYEREFHDSDVYVSEWITYLLDEIKSGELEMDNVVSLVDFMFPRNRIFSLDREQLKNIRNIMRLGDSQKRQCIYIIMRVSLILIKDFPNEENLGILVENIIKAKALTLLKVVMKVADENDGVEVLKGHLLDIVEGITDSQPKEVINEWFSSHNFPLPRYEEESESDEDDRPLQISRLTPPEQKVRGGRWFGRIRKY